MSLHIDSEAADWVFEWGFGDGAPRRVGLGGAKGRKGKLGGGGGGGGGGGDGPQHFHRSYKLAARGISCGSVP
eukprot:SAG22_NODE_2038_length_3098_cov_1.624542_3_plen_73_part_00